MRRLTALTFLAIWLGAVLGARADLVLSVSDATIDTSLGQTTAEMDVFAISDVGDTPLAAYTLSAVITPVSSPEELVFDATQPDVTAAQIFGSDSTTLGSPLGGPTGDLVSGFTTYPFDTYYGFDATLNSSDVTIGATSKVLLGVLRVALTSDVAGTFQVSVDTSSFFSNANGLENISGATSGTVTVEGASPGIGAVPEPATWQLALSAAALGGLFAWRRGLRTIVN